MRPIFMYKPEILLVFFLVNVNVTEALLLLLLLWELRVQYLICIFDMKAFISFVFNFYLVQFTFWHYSCFVCYFIFIKLC